MITDDQFKSLMKIYREEFIKWHHIIRKHLKIDRETFLAEFQNTLFRAMLRFNVEKATAKDKRFERYFHASLKKMCKSLIRKQLTNKRIAERHNVSFCLKKHDIADEDALNPIDFMLVADWMNICCLTDLQKTIVRLKLDNYSVPEICQNTHLTMYGYRIEMEKIKSNSCLQHKLSSH